MTPVGVDGPGSRSFRRRAARRCLVPGAMATYPPPGGTPDPTSPA
ncbi:hypothetical protein ACP70R_001063 [Stipagrostis hirtigluma subsp. patula]